MHVLQIPSWYPSDAAPLNGSFFVEQFGMLADAGLQVGVLAVLPTRFEHAQRGTSVAHETRDGMPVLRVQVGTLPSPLGRLEWNMFRRQLARAADFYERLAGVPDVLHAHSVFPGAIAARYLAQLWNRPYVITEHRPSSVLQKPHGLRGLKIREAVQEAAVRMTVSSRFGEALGRYYGTEPWEAVELPTPHSFFEVQRPQLSESAPFVFLHVSHLDENKRVHQLCRVFAGVYGNDPAVRLTIAGGNAGDIDAVRKRSDIASWPSNIEFTGLQSREQVVTLMASANCFVLTSASEAGGTVFSEAQAVGTPIIASDTWAGDFAVREGVGIVIPVDDDLALEQAMVDARRPGTFADSGRIRALAASRYSPQKFAARTTEAYARAIQSKRRPAMVFHTPIPLIRNGGSASRIRPLRMLEAFRDAGYEVIEISGNATQRRRQIREAKARIKSGRKPEFVYSELASMPLALSGSVKQGIHPFLDLAFFRFCKSQGVPVGAFYRDIYWKFEGEKPATWYLRAANVFYQLDERAFPSALSVMFLPSLQMGDYIEFPKQRMAALPPGAEIVEQQRSNEAKLLYVGSLGGYYRLHRLVEAVSQVPEVSLTLCVPEGQWLEYREEYSAAEARNITVVHESGDGLTALYAVATIGVLCVEPIEYRTFAAPFKLYEYLGQGLPVLASSGTHAGTVIAEAEAGWEVDYSTEAIVRILRQLVADPNLVESARNCAESARAENTWLARAHQAAAALER